MSRADHIARAERMLDGTHAESVTEAALLALAHVAVAWVRHEVGVWDE